jgi:hypothetical protein
MRCILAPRAHSLTLNLKDCRMQKSHRLWVTLATSGFLAMAPALVSAQGAGVGGGTGNTSGGATSTGTGQGRSSTGSSMEIGQGHRTTAPTERDKSNMTTNPRDNERNQTSDLGTPSESHRRTPDSTSRMEGSSGSSQSPSGQSPAGEPPPSPSGQSPAGEPPPSPSGQAINPSGSSSANR